MMRREGNSDDVLRAAQRPKGVGVDDADIAGLTKNQIKSALSYLRDQLVSHKFSHQVVRYFATEELRAAYVAQRAVPAAPTKRMQRAATYKPVEQRVSPTAQTVIPPGVQVQQCPGYVAPYQHGLPAPKPYQRTA